MSSYQPLGEPAQDRDTGRGATFRNDRCVDRRAVGCRHVRPCRRGRRDVRTMVVIQDGHRLDARRQHQAGSRCEHRGVVPPLRSAHQVAGGLRDAASRVAVAARAGVADPTLYTTTGRAARPPRTPRRLRVPPPTPSARSPSACSRLPLMLFTHVPLLPWSEAAAALLPPGPAIGDVVPQEPRDGSGPALPAGTHAPYVDLADREDRGLGRLGDLPKRGGDPPLSASLGHGSGSRFWWAHRTRVVPARYPDLRSRPPRVLVRLVSV